MFSFYKRKRKILKFTKEGIVATMFKNNTVIIDWKQIDKLTFVGVFEEYSGYFLTKEYQNKELYHSIFIDCSENVVKFFNGKVTRKVKNISESFSINHGKTIMHRCFFVEYTDDLKRKKLYVSNYKKDKKEEEIAVLKTYLLSEKIEVKDYVFGFNGLSFKSLKNKYQENFHTSTPLDNLAVKGVL